MMNIHQILHIVSQVTYKPNWCFRVKREGDRSGRPYIQVEVTDTLDSVTGEATWWRGGKHYLSFHMCRQEVVGVCYKAIQEAEVHEMREWFRYRGASIYNPHIDPDALVEVCRDKANFVMRNNAMTMEEDS